MLCLLFLTGCAFDVLHEKQLSASFAPISGQGRTWTLNEDLDVSFEGTTYKTHLKKGTRWQEVGHIAQGDVYVTKDQIVTVEGSNIHEAQVVLSGESVVGCFLPVEGTFAPARKPVAVHFAQN